MSTAEPLPSEPAPQPVAQPVPPAVPRPMRDARYDWAAERTLLAWVRTGLAMMGFGFVVARFGAFTTTSMVAGILMVAFGMVANLVAVRRFLRNHRALSRGEPIDPSPTGPAALAVFAALLGGALAALLGHTLLN